MRFINKIELLKNVSEIKFCNPIKSEKKEKLEYIVVSELLPNNHIRQLKEENNYRKDDELKIRKGDIIVKRISPSYINYIYQEFNEVYIFSNLFRIRANMNIDSKYLAYIINQKINRMVSTYSLGNAMKAIDKKTLEEMQIPILSLKEQEKIGTIWFNMTLKTLEAEKLVEKEKKKYESMLKKYINNKLGGNKNDYI